MTPPTDATAWRCPRCDADRTAADAFCGRCGARRPRPEASADGDASHGDQSRRIPIARALVLNGVILGAVVLAVVFGSGGGSTSIAFDPAAWRCDGSERSWVATIPPAHPDLRIEWRTGGPVGDVRAGWTTTRLALEPDLTGDGSVRFSTSNTDAPECALEPGTYTMTIRDAASGALVASGDVVLETDR